MKKAFIFILSLLLISSCSSSQSKSSFDEGVEHFKKEQYKWAAQSFTVALTKDPKFADAAYNAGIAYLKLNDSDNALFYFEKTVNLSPFHIDAWYNIAVIRYNKDQYKKAVIASFNALDKGKDLLEKSYKMLKSKGFIYRDYAQLKSQPELTVPEFQNADLKELNFILSIDENGKVQNISDCSLKDENICKYYKDQLKNLEFIPAYDFEREIKSQGFLYASITFQKETAPNISLLHDSTVNKDITKLKGNNLHGALDRKEIDTKIRDNIVKFRKCYEKELDKNPKTHGRIVINFIIGASGRVFKTNLKSSTMNNEKVEQCVEKEIGNLMFPSPKNGGIVIVNYPFVFKHTEG